jgi:hypothetical protein
MGLAAWCGCGLLLGVTGCAATAPTTYWTQVGEQRVHLEGDVAEGYRAYKDRLAAWGTWSTDSLQGVHWCPSVPPSSEDEASFQPYRTGGHWEPLAPAAATAYGVPRGTPSWVSESGTPWENITLHHGRWTRPDEEQRGTWCWVPGAVLTPAAVVWRTGDGFVGWAPAPADGDYDPGNGDDGAWSYEFLAALFEDVLDSQLLSGDAGEQAASATRPSAPPARGAVADARRQLGAYIQAHPQGVAQSEPKGGSPGSGSAGHVPAQPAVAKTGAFEMPSGMALYQTLADRRPGAFSPSTSRDPGPYAWSKTEAHPVHRVGVALAGGSSAAHASWEGSGGGGSSSSSGHGSGSSSSHSSSSHSSSSHSSSSHHH